MVTHCMADLARFKLGPSLSGVWAILIVSKTRQSRERIVVLIYVSPHHHNGISCGGSRGLLNTWSGISSFVPNERKRKPKGDMQGSTRQTGSAKRLDARVHVRRASLSV